MGFFSELKSDLSQAVNTLRPEDKPEAGGERSSESNGSRQQLTGPEQGQGTDIRIRRQDGKDSGQVH